MAIRLDGKQIAAEIRGSLKEKVDEIRKTVPDFSPGLAIVQESFFMFNRGHVPTRTWIDSTRSKDSRVWAHYKTIARLAIGKIQMFISV